ncbi:MAG: hypothetical protein H0W43_13040 [Chthoniobacterales bacterium]|nr:hypothetical protein [Chthoniobacterales bacterium]
MRQKLSSPLPRLPRRLSRRNGETPAEALFRLLRGIARSSRRSQDQTFYSLREIAGHFDLPLSLVSRVFARLETEGLLGRVRGSRTVLHGRKLDRHLYVRGVVGIPVSLFRFSAFAGYREFVTLLRRKLRRRGFMPAAVFFRHEESRGNFLAQSLLEAQADTVVWFSPPREAPETVSFMRDAGVRVVGVAESVSNVIPCRYQIQREEALRKILREWRVADLASTVVVTAERGGSPADEESYRLVSNEELLPSTSITLDKDNAQRASRVIWRSERCGILLTKSGAAFLAVREPEIFARLTKERRVALVEGPISVTFAVIPAARVDLIAVDWEKVAERIVADLIDPAPLPAAGRIVFKAATRLRVALERGSHRL